MLYKMNQSDCSVTEQYHLCLFFQILMNVFLRRSHATEDRSVSTQSAPTSARGTLSTVAEDTTSMMMAHAVLVRQKKNQQPFSCSTKQRRYIWLRSLLRSPLQILMSVRSLKWSAKVMVVSTCWAPTAVSVSPATSSTASAGSVRVSSFILLGFVVRMLSPLHLTVTRFDSVL